MSFILSCLLNCVTEVIQLAKDLMLASPDQHRGCIIPQAVTHSLAPEDGRNQRPKHVELIGIINKPLFLHLVCVYIIYINDSRSKKIKFLSRIFKLHLNMTIITVALLEVQYAFLITSGSILLKMRNVLDMICRENRKAFCVQELFFSKILPFLR